MSSGEEAKDMGTAKRALEERLPELLSHALEAYAGLADGGPPADAKDAVQYHNACKAALGHLDMLAKLARWVDGSTRTAPLPDDPMESPDALLARARAALDTSEDAA